MPNNTRHLHFAVLTAAIATCLSACSERESASPEASSETTTIAPKTITDAQMEERAAQIRNQVNFELAEGVTADLWASEDLLADPIALSMDYQGRAWVAITNRSNNSEFDIRPYPQWITPSVAMESNEDRRKFLREYFASEKNLTEEEMPDRNGDGVHDWRDLAVVKEQVLQVVDRSGDGRADESSVFLEDFNSEITDAMGAIYYDNRDDQLFLGVAPSAWRVKDTNGDGVADDKQMLSDGFGVHIGFSGHGMSGMTQGPDGRIYYGIGDIGANIIDAEGKRHPYPHMGVVVRSEPDGSGFEVFAHGVRNTHEFSFDQYGNLVSVDNDGDHPGEFERLVYLIDGSDSGWRIHWQFGKYTDPKNNDYKVWMDEEFYKPRFASQAAHILPPVAAHHAGPSGMVYNPGTALSERWKDHFFIVQFAGSGPRSGVNAFTLAADGAGFKLESDVPFMRGVQSTGLDVGVDGALYTSDWIEGWGRNGKGRIWKLDTPSTADLAMREETAKLLRDGFAQRDINELRELLGHADMRVRSNAQFELVDRRATDTLVAALANEEQLARIHAIWGIGQLARADAEAAAVLLPLLDDADPEIRAQSAKVIGDAAYPGATSALLANLKHDNARVRFFATQALGRLGQRDAVAPIIAMLEANNDDDVYLRQAGAIALARIGDEEALAALAEHPSEALRVAAVVALRRLKSPALALFLNDRSEFVVTNAARAINDDEFVDKALPALAQLLAKPSFNNEALLRRSINANAFVADEPAAKRLADFAADASQPAAMRAEALAALGQWAAPSVFDRVSGRYRGERSGNAQIASSALADLYTQLLRDHETLVREATISTLGELGIAQAIPLLQKSLSEDKNAAVRMAALLNLQKLDHGDMEKAIYTGLNDTDVEVRMAALAMVPTLSIPAATQVDMHSILLREGSVAEQQTALLSLANIKAPETEQLLAEQMQLLLAGELAAAIKLELVNAVSAYNSSVLNALLADYEASKDGADALAVYAEALDGGNPDRGRNIFRYNSSAQCVRCHVVGSRGSHVGPELTHISQLLSKAQLLEAMVDPGARIAPGFGRISLTFKDGSVVEGLFSAETEDSLQVTSSSGEVVEVARHEVAEQSLSPSGMPPMGALLNKSQLRDLVAYLNQLDGAEAAETH